MPSVDTTKNAPAMVRSSQLTPQPQNTGTAAASARKGTSRNVRMVISSASVCRPSSTGFGAGGAAFTEAVMHYSFRGHRAGPGPRAGGRGAGTPGGQRSAREGGDAAPAGARPV